MGSASAERVEQEEVEWVASHTRSNYMAACYSAIRLGCRMALVGTGYSNGFRICFSRLVMVERKTV